MGSHPERSEASANARRAVWRASAEPSDPGFDPGERTGVSEIEMAGIRISARRAAPQGRTAAGRSARARAGGEVRSTELAVSDKQNSHLHCPVRHPGGSRGPWFNARAIGPWIPAFAGMTPRVRTNRREAPQGQQEARSGAAATGTKRTYGPDTLTKRCKVRA